jgi:N-acetyl-alpha-D-glucosaminyl L-malate synthase BshA
MAAETRPLRIGITCYPTAGGSGVIATELGIELARRGHQVHFICQQVPLRLRDYHPNIGFHPVEAASYPVFHHQPYSLNLAAKMSEVATSHRLDLLHVHYAIPHATSAVLAREIVAPQPLRVLTTLHGTDITLVGMEPSFFSVTRFSIERSDGVTVVSEWLAHRTRETFAVDVPLAVVRNFVDTERFRPLVDAERRRRFAAPEERIVLHASNFRPVKNTVRVVEVFAALARRLPARLVMIGEGPELVRCEEVARRLDVAERVSFLGSQEYIESLLPLADLFLLPSEHEAFGLAALEAMSCAVPVIATANGGTAEIIAEGVNGHLVDAADTEAMVARGAELLADSRRCRAMGEAARRTVCERFGLADAISRYERIYAELMAKRR